MVRVEIKYNTLERMDVLKELLSYPIEELKRIKDNYVLIEGIHNENIIAVHEFLKADFYPDRTELLNDLLETYGVDKLQLVLTSEYEMINKIKKVLNLILVKYFQEPVIHVCYKYSQESRIPYQIFSMFRDDREYAVKSYHGDSEGYYDFLITKGDSFNG